MLAWFGADVIKIEHPSKGDPTRTQLPDIPDLDGMYYLQLNSNKRSIELDAKTPEGKEILTKLIQQGDVFIENLHPGALDEMGFTWEHIHEINPKIIFGTIKGFSENSPYANVKAYEPVAQCAGGAAATTGWWSGDNNIPTQSSAALGDSNTGMHMVIGLLAALLQRQKTGVGQKVTQSMQDAVLNLCRIKFRDQIILDHLGVLSYYPQYPDGKFGNTIPRAGNVEGGAVLGWCYKCKGWETDSNAYVYIVLPRDDKEFAEACKGLGKEAWITDPKFSTGEARDAHKFEIYKEIEEFTIDKDKFELVDELGKFGIPCGPVLSMLEIKNDKSLRESGSIVEVEQIERGKYLTIGMPMKFSDFKPTIKGAPLLGEHTDEVLQELGYSVQDIIKLREKKVVSSK